MGEKVNKKELKEFTKKCTTEDLYAIAEYLIIEGEWRIKKASEKLE